MHGNGAFIGGIVKLRRVKRAQRNPPRQFVKSKERGLRKQDPFVEGGYLEKKKRKNNS